MIIKTVKVQVHKHGQMFIAIPKDIQNDMELNKGEEINITYIKEGTWELTKKEKK
mgnify:CR=1 FL=1